MCTDLKLRKSERERFAFCGLSFVRLATTTQHRHLWPVPSLPEGIREEGWGVRGGDLEVGKSWEKERERE
jgi:hypothetical protein